MQCWFATAARISGEYLRSGLGSIVDQVLVSSTMMLTRQCQLHQLRAAAHHEAASTRLSSSAYPKQLSACQLSDTLAYGALVTGIITGKRQPSFGSRTTGEGQARSSSLASGCKPG